MLKLHTKLHALTPALALNLQPESANSASPLLRAALSSLRGLTRRSSRSSDLVGHRAFLCSDSDSSGDVVVHVEAKAVDSEAEEVDTKSSSAIVSTNPRPEDYLTVLALPLPHRPLFPGFYMPIYVKEYPMEACKLHLSVQDLSNNSLAGLPQKWVSSLVSGPTPALLKYLRIGLSETLKLQHQQKRM